MKQYSKNWDGSTVMPQCIGVSSHSDPMRLKIEEETNSEIYIAASLEFKGSSKRKKAQSHRDSAFYKIEVNGEALVQYHVTNPRRTHKSIGVNLHGRANIPAGENTVEVLYKVAKSDNWEKLHDKSVRKLNILSYPLK